LLALPLGLQLLEFSAEAGGGGRRQFDPVHYLKVFIFEMIAAFSEFGGLALEVGKLLGIGDPAAVEFLLGGGELGGEVVYFPFKGVLLRLEFLKARIFGFEFVPEPAYFLAITELTDDVALSFLVGLKLEVVFL